MATFEVGEHTYRSGTIPAMQQFHVGRRLAPVLPAFRDLIPIAGMLQSMSGAMKEGKPLSREDVTEIALAVEPVVKAFASLSDADCEYVLAATLGVTQRQQGQIWAPVWSKSANALMFDDLDAAGMLQIAAIVLMGSFQRFFPTPPSASTNTAAA